MTTDTYEVLYNDHPESQFRIPIDVCEEMFRRFPPGTDIGNVLFQTDRFPTFVKDGETPDPKWPLHRFIDRYAYFSEGFKRVYYSVYTQSGKFITDGSNTITDGDKYYCLHPYPTKTSEWRKHPDVIQCVKEKGYIGKKISGVTLQIKRFPVGYLIGERDSCVYCKGEQDVCVYCQEEVYPMCPTVKIIGDLLEIIKNGSKDSVHCLTQKLLDGANIAKIIYPDL